MFATELSIVLLVEATDGLFLIEEVKISKSSALSVKFVNHNLCVLQLVTFREEVLEEIIVKSCIVEVADKKAGGAIVLVLYSWGDIELTEKVLSLLHLHVVVSLCWLTHLH